MANFKEIIFPLWKQNIYLKVAPIFERIWMIKGQLPSYKEVFPWKILTKSPGKPNYCVIEQESIRAVWIIAQGKVSFQAECVDIFSYFSTKMYAIEK